MSQKEGDLVAHIIIHTTPEEHEQVLKALKTLTGRTIAVSEIADKAGMSANRVRYVLADLIEDGKIKRIPTKAFNKYYVRYMYEIV